MKPDRHSNGFSVVEGLLILVIASMLGSIGWFVFQSQNQTNKSLQNASESSAMNANPTVSKDDEVAKVPIIDSCTPNIDPLPGGQVQCVTLRNNDNISHSVTVKVVWKGGNQTLEVNRGTLKDIAPGETKNLSIQSTDNIAGFNAFETSVEKVE